MGTGAYIGAVGVFDNFYPVSSDWPVICSTKLLRTYLLTDFIKAIQN